MSEAFMCDLCPPISARPPASSRPWSEEEYQLHLTVVHECELCGMLCESEQRRNVHWWRIHGKDYRLEEWFEISGNEVIPRVGRFVDVSDWRNPIETLPGVPNDPEALCRWLYPMCLRMLEFKHPEVALFSPQQDLVAQALYTEVNFRVVRAATSTARFKRLRGQHAKAVLMAKALALPNCAPGYAEQQLRGCQVDRAT